MKKVLIPLILVLIVYGGYYVYKSRSKTVFINPIEFSEFNRLVPSTSVSCSQEDAIGFYYYESVEEKDRKNNKFGLYIYPDNERFIELADQLVNSNGGDWGYVLIPYNLQERDRGKWQRVFYLLNKKHLIPVVQLWNINPDKYEEDTEKAAEFLNSFVWPVKQRYISVYNEPNDADFWYGRVDPEEYAKILDYTILEFKGAHEDFFILNGAFNVSAATTSTSVDSFEYMRQMNLAVPGIFEKLDGWASHSYPQPNFSGSPHATGRWSIKAYGSELDFLESEFGVIDLPVFITETGWAHDAGKTYNFSYPSLDKVADYMVTAYQEVWLPDDRVKAVMPFTVWYAPPFDHFSWVDNRWMPYEQFQAIKALKKTAGTPQKFAVAETTSLGCE